MLSASLNKTFPSFLITFFVFVLQGGDGDPEYDHPADYDGIVMFVFKAKSIFGSKKKVCRAHLSTILTCLYTIMS